MNIYVYSDESGVLDKQHNSYYVFGGVLFLSGEDRDTCSRRFVAAEKNIRSSENISTNTEVKACNIQGNLISCLWQQQIGITNITINMQGRNIVHYILRYVAASCYIWWQ